MKNRINYYVLLLFLGLAAAACSKEEGEIVELKVVREDFVFRSQADVDKFLSDHTDAKKVAIDGNLTIGMPVKGGESSDITSLQGLRKLKEVRKNLTLSMNQNLKTCQGLENLDRVKGTFLIVQNALQQSPELVSLALVDSLVITQNPSLPSLITLGQLSRITTLVIAENPALESLQGLGNIDSLTNLAIDQNNSLLDLSGLGSLKKVVGVVDISRNAELASLDGLDSLAQTGSFSILSNPKLTDFCALTEAIGQLLADHPEASPDELSQLMKLQDNGRSPYSWEEILSDCAD